jgi:hypothetical protein
MAVRSLTLGIIGKCDLVVCSCHNISEKLSKSGNLRILAENIGI